MSDTQNTENTEIVDETDVDLLIQDETEETNVEDQTTPAIQLTNEMWVAMGTQLGLTNISAQNAQTQIAEMIRIGQKYDNLVRVNAKKMSIASGLGNMDTFIDSLPHDNVLGQLRESTKIAESKGLLTGTRASVPIDNTKVPAGSGTAPAPQAQDTTGGERTPEAVVSDTKKELRGSGMYAL